MATALDSSQPSELVDLHSHTNESDGSLTPAELVALARQVGLHALAITDHDTFRGYELASGFAREAGLDLVCGIELNTRMNADRESTKRSVHLLAYFLTDAPPAAFAAWLEGERHERRNRNAGLVKKLQRDGLDITLEEVEARGRSLAGRPHFARILVEKGYVANPEEAFHRYLGEGAPSFVPRQSKTAEEVIAVVRASGGLPVIAHPVRLELDRAEERDLLIRYRRAGLAGLEIYHSEHTPELQAHYRQLAEDLELLPTGGSDFHGSIKPNVQLGIGLNGNVRVPRQFLDGLRQAAAA